MFNTALFNTIIFNSPYHVDQGDNQPIQSVMSVEQAVALYSRDDRTSISNIPTIVSLASSDTLARLSDMGTTTILTGRTK